MAFPTKRPRALERGEHALAFGCYVPGGFEQNPGQGGLPNLNIIRKWALSILKLLDLGKPYSLKKKRFALCCAFPEYIGKLMAL